MPGKQREKNSFRTAVGPRAAQRSAQEENHTARKRGVLYGRKKTLDVRHRPLYAMKVVIRQAVRSPWHIGMHSTIRATNHCLLSVLNQPLPPTWTQKRIFNMFENKSDYCVG